MKIYLVLALLLCSEVSGLVITEVMYNPAGDDNNLEFIEVLGTDNLTGLVVGDLNSNDTLILMHYHQGNLSLITEEGFNYSGVNASVFSSGSTIGNALGNTQDSVFIYFNSTLVASMSYNGSLANGNNKSMELVDGVWVESCEDGGTPGRLNCIRVVNQTVNSTMNVTLNVSPNITECVNMSFNLAPNITLNVTSNITNTTINTSNPVNISNTSSNVSVDIKPLVKIEHLLSNITAGVEYESLFKITNLNRTRMSVTVNYNLTRQGELVFERNFTREFSTTITANTGWLLVDEPGDYLLCASAGSVANCSSLHVHEPEECSAVLLLTTDKDQYVSGESVKILLELNITPQIETDYVIEYWVEDLGGKELRRSNTTNLNQKSYKPKVKEKLEAFVLKAEIVSISCESSGFASKTVVFTNPSYKPKEKVEINKTKKLEKKLAKIASFYTRAKLYKENITLYAAIESVGGALLVLKGNGGEQSMEINGSSKLNFSWVPVLGNNTAVLEVWEGGVVSSSKEISFFLKGEPPAKESEESEVVVEEAPEEVLADKIEIKPELHEPMQESPTASVVYESSSEKMKQYSPLLIIMVSGFVVVGYFVVSRR